LLEGSGIRKAGFMMIVNFLWLSFYNSARAWLHWNKCVSH